MSGGPAKTGPAGERLVPCPTCRQPAPYSERNRWRPFCSERCRGIDLGAWASEGYRVSDPAPPDDPPRNAH